LLVLTKHNFFFTTNVANCQLLLIIIHYDTSLENDNQKNSRFAFFFFQRNHGFFESKIFSLFFKFWKFIKAKHFNENFILIIHQWIMKSRCFSINFCTQTATIRMTYSPTEKEKNEKPYADLSAISFPVT
jgi:hypothetical protein